MSRNLRAVHSDIMQRVRAGEGITRDELAVIKEYAKSCGSPAVIADYSIAKTAVNVEQTGKEDTPINVEKLEHELRQLKEKTRESGGRTQAMVAYVNKKAEIQQQQADERNREVYRKLLDESKKAGNLNAFVEFLKSDQ